MTLVCPNCYVGSIAIDDDNREAAVNWSYDANGGQRYMAQMMVLMKWRKKQDKKCSSKSGGSCVCTMMGFTEDDAVLALNQPGITGAGHVNWLMDTSAEDKVAFVQCS